MVFVNTYIAKCLPSTRSQSGKTLLKPVTVYRLCYFLQWTIRHHSEYVDLELWYKYILSWKKKWKCLYLMKTIAKLRQIPICNECRLCVTPHLDNTSVNHDIFVSTLSPMATKRWRKFTVVTTPLFSTFCGQMIDRSSGCVQSAWSVTYIPVQSIWNSIHQGIRPMLKQAQRDLMYKCCEVKFQWRSLHSWIQLSVTASSWYTVMNIFIMIVQLYSL